MGYMVDGIYHVGDDVTKTLPNGEWERTKSTIRNWISDGGEARGEEPVEFSAEGGRYHLFAAWNCPWAHRVLLTRAILGLEQHISVSYALPYRNEQGWIFDETGDFADPLLGVSAIHEVYSRQDPKYTGRLTVPVFWDKKTGAIVSNESADLVRMLGASFASMGAHSLDLYPESLRLEIDQWNDLIYSKVNNGVYRAGFARTQESYENAAIELFETLDKIDNQLAKTRYIAGDQFTEADLRLFPTLARFDCAYHYAFKCNLRRISDYEFLWPYARDIYQMPGIRETVRFEIYKQGYHSKNENRNPLGIVPIGPLIDWDVPHNRA